VPQDEAEPRHEQQQEREQRQEAVIREERSERTAAVVAELLDDSERERGGTVALLKGIEPPQPPLQRVHGSLPFDVAG
jgi:hypothetical protein